MTNNKDTPDDELIDILIAVSVVAKRLAEKLRKEKALREIGRLTKNGGYSYEQERRTQGFDGAAGTPQ